MRSAFFVASSAVALAFAAAVVLAAGPQKQPAKDLPAPVATKPTDALTERWNAFKEGAYEAWQATTNAFDEMTRQSQQDVVLATALPGAISGKQLLGTPIENVKEGRVGSISDLVLGKDSHVDAIVVSDGGFLGIGNAQIPVKPGLISIRREKDGKLRALTNITETHLDEAALNGAFRTRIEAMRADFKKPDVKTVARLIGASVVGPDNKTVGAVNDLLLSPVGEAQYALVSVGGTMGVGAKQVAVKVSSLHFTRSGEPLKTSMTIEQLKALAPVRSSAAASMIGN